MAIPAQGALNQMKPQQAGGKFDAGAVQAENIEKMQSGATGLKDSVTDDLSDQREAMNNILLRLREGLDNRKNRMFDPVLMQTAAGFLKPTKTGSFGESLGYAAENAGVEAEKEMLRQRESQKLEMELAGKEMEFRQQLGGDAFVNKLMGRTAAPAGVPSGVPSGAPITQAPGEAGRTMPPMVPASGVPPAGQNPQQVLSAAAQGRIKVTDEVLLMASRINPKILPTLQEMRRSQETDVKNRIDQERLDVERAKLAQDKRKVVPRGQRTEREMNAAEYAEYQAKLQEYFNTGDEKALLEYYNRKGWIEQEQARILAGKNGIGQKISNVDYNSLIAKTAQELVTEQKYNEQQKLMPGELYKAEQLSLIKRAEEIAIATGKAVVEVQRDIDIARGKLPIAVQQAGDEETARSRSKDAEAKATTMVTQANVAFANITTADDMIGYAKNNPKILQAMNIPGVFGAVARAAQEGIKFGNYSVSLPADTLLKANLSSEDLSALQMFAQKYAELQSRGRQLNRTPGEGSTSDYETKLLGAIYALPTYSQRAVILKSEALKLQSMFDEERFKLWVPRSKKPGYTYNDFMLDDDYKSLKSEYKKTLDRVREENLDLLSPKRKPPAAPAAPPSPAASAAPPPAPAASAPAPAAPAVAPAASVPPAAPPRPAPAPAPPAPSAAPSSTAPALTDAQKQMQVLSPELRPNGDVQVTQDGKNIIIGRVKKEDYESNNFDAAKEIIHQWMLTQATPAPKPTAVSASKPSNIITEKKEGFSEKLRRLQK